MPEVLILTGPPSSGKSTVARALAERYDRVAHVEVDTLRHFVTPTGYVSPGKPGFERQKRLAIRNACALAVNFLAERFAVIVDDVVEDRAAFELYLEGLRPGGAPVHFVRLMPRLEACLARNQSRREGRLPAGRVEAVWREFERAGEIAGCTVDSSDLTAYATADRLQALTTSGESIVWRPGAPGSPAGAVEVVRFGPEHHEWAAELIRRHFGSERMVSRGRLYDTLSLPGLVALIDGQPAGVALYNVEDGSCELVTLASSLEGRGAATALLEALKKEAATLGCRRLWLITTNDNTPAMRFYQRRGFRLAAVHPGAVEASREIKPEIPRLGRDGIEIRDEVEFEIDLGGRR